MKQISNQAYLSKEWICYIVNGVKLIKRYLSFINQISAKRVSVNAKIVCTAVQKNRKDNLDYYQEYERGRANAPHRVKARYDYARTEGGKEARFRVNSAHYYRYPKRSSARYSVQNAVRDGKLMKPENCSKCNASGNIHGHHSDYNKPLEVIWFCESCHAEWHRNNTPIYCD